MDSTIVPLVIAPGFVVLVIAATFIGTFLQDKKLHRGLSWFDRRRIRRGGVRATATVLSEKSFRKAGDLEFDYVVQVEPLGARPFRALVATSLTSRQISWIRVGDEVPVFYDAKRRDVVIFDMPALAEIVARRRRQSEIAAGEEQRRLLRGD